MDDTTAAERRHCIIAIPIGRSNFTKIHEANCDRDYWGHYEKYSQVDFAKDDDARCHCQGAAVPASQFWRLPIMFWKFQQENWVWWEPRLSQCLWIWLSRQLWRVHKQYRTQIQGILDEARKWWFLDLVAIQQQEQRIAGEAWFSCFWQRFQRLSSCRYADWRKYLRQHQHCIQAVVRNVPG